MQRAQVWSLFQQLAELLPEEQRKQLQEQIATQDDEGETEEPDERAQIIAALPAAVRDAIAQGDAQALQAALSALPPDEAAAIVAQLKQIGVLGTQRGPDMHQVMQKFLPLLGDIALAALGNEASRALAEAVLPQLEQGGWRLSDATQHIWAGERDEAALTANIDANSAQLVRRILRFIADGSDMIFVAGSLQIANLRQRVDADAAQALASGDRMQRTELAQRFEQLAEQAAQQLGAPWHELVAHLQALVTQLSD